MRSKQLDFLAEACDESNSGMNKQASAEIAITLTTRFLRENVDVCIRFPTIGSQHSHSMPKAAHGANVGRARLRIHPVRFSRPWPGRRSQRTMTLLYHLTTLQRASAYARHGYCRYTPLNSEKRQYPFCRLGNGVDGA
jgi:hypothetical protein